MSTKRIGLRGEVYYGNRQRDYAVALHEFGHALQYKNKPFFMSLFRWYKALFPFLIGGTIIANEIVHYTEWLNYAIGVILYLCYSIILVLIEHNASQKAIHVILEYNLYNKYGVLLDQVTATLKNNTRIYLVSTISGFIALFGVLPLFLHLLMNISSLRIK